ncbi:PQQ-binding-like beta-propeller repeat protein [Plebeiibacterium marinum]|uniref:PQQ-binding-like beta-propeller repeat protein n=1 Tax=Plebeiibacterium marinum TaxID=2992111 RepID=A0AAE3MDA3_9BACT|nr:PQQ-binding-like beta-propeller repeat protein [Plebeiobacterium marinum]MCW3805521.1 PQQ-binding-like beta-propeller repeat protein [Plebeiobacterium marinum]
MIKKLILYLITIILSTACQFESRSSDAVGDLNWRLFRGNSGLSGYTDKSLPENPVLLWTYKAGIRTVSSPVVEEGTTYWCDRRGLIHGVDINGKQVFSYSLNTTVEATPLIKDSVLYIGRIDGFLTAISLSQKDTLWNYETLGQISASPNVATFKNQQAIVTGSYDNYMYCINQQTGTLINKFESGYYLNGAAALWNNYVLFGGCDAWLRIINCETGEATDSLETEAYIPSSPAIMGNYCYVGDYSGNMYEILLNNGKIEGHKKVASATNDNGSFISVPAISAHDVYFYPDDRHLLSVNRRTGKTNWKFMMKGDVGESAPVICNDKIIACTKTGIITIIDEESGNQIWEYDAGEQIIGSPAIIKDHFMILTSKGTLFCFGSQKK